MIKQAGILLTLCATSLVVINIRTLETVERSGRGIDDDDPYNDKDDYEVRRGTGYRPPLVIETCLVARWAGYPAAFSSSWGFFADLEMADGAVSNTGCKVTKFSELFSEAGLAFLRH